MKKLFCLILVSFFFLLSVSCASFAEWVQSDSYYETTDSIMDVMEANHEARYR